MSYKYFSHNGELQPIERAVVPLSRVEYSYGFGVYESIRVSKGRILFAQEHSDRLLKSASIIGLEHNFDSGTIQQYISELVEANKASDCNLKLLLIGAPKPEDATLDIICLNPLFPDRKLYSQGATCITYEHGREFLDAKTLNMLSSYLAYREAKLAGAYDALLINKQGFITEGTRTNFFALQGKTLITPPANQVLMGIARQNVIKVATDNAYTVEEKELRLQDLTGYAPFLTSTSAKIMPISKINDQKFGPPSDELKHLMKLFDEFLDAQ